MRPANVESNLYQYHLLQLQKQGFIIKQDNVYMLTGRGLSYADRHSTTLKKTRSQPKLITVLFLANNDGELLLVPKVRQPFMDTLNLPSGKIHLEETIAEAAAREFEEKLPHSIELNSLDHFGVSHITIKQDDFVVSDYIALLMRGTIDITGELPPGSMLVNPVATQGLKLMPSVSELLEAYLSQCVFSENVVQA